MKIQKRYDLGSLQTTQVFVFSEQNGQNDRVADVEDVVHKDCGANTLLLSFHVVGNSSSNRQFGYKKKKKTLQTQK